MPGLECEAAHHSRGMKQGRAVYLEARTQRKEVERLGSLCSFKDLLSVAGPPLLCLMAMPGAACRGVLHFHKHSDSSTRIPKTMSQNFPLCRQLSQAFCYSNGQLSNLVSMIPCLQNRVPTVT